MKLQKIKKPFKIVSHYQPAGDQPTAIEALVKSLKSGNKRQTLLGATGTGKTFTMAHVIEHIQKPTLIIAHNKTLAAQLAQEFSEFFPDAAVHYFVSYYDYYQPEAYVVATDTFIEKDASINAEIDKLRHATTQALLTRNDVIIIASVSCIYGLGSPEEYLAYHKVFMVGQKITRTSIMEHLIGVHYERTNADLKAGTFRAMGNKIEIMPTGGETLYSITLFGDTITSIIHIDPVSSVILGELDSIMLFPAKHFLTEKESLERAIVGIEEELKNQLEKFKEEGKVLEYERLRRRTTYDLALLKEVGYCSGIENYSRHMSGKKEGEAPESLLAYFPHKENGESDFLTIIDESHVTLPQLRAMYAGDQARKENLVNHGFRLPSAKDNRPMRYEEFDEKIGQVVYVSATPALYEKENASVIAEQIIRPTGLLDPVCEIRPVTGSESNLGQVQDFIRETKQEIEKNKSRVIATTLTKKMAEDLSEYLKSEGIKAEYMHSDIKTIERIEIISKFRRGEFDCIVGVNLLREGLDMPEVTLIGILDADKEGFLRSETSLIQVIGRAARNSLGRVILYADRLTGSMERALGETNRRRKTQEDYNTKHGITPQTILKNVRDITNQITKERDRKMDNEIRSDLKMFEGNAKKLVNYKVGQMEDAVRELDFETAGILRDEIIMIESKFNLKPIMKGKKNK